MNMIQYFGTGIGLFAIGKISAYAADRYLIHHTNLGRFTVVQIENFPLAFFLCSSPWRLGPDSPIFQIPAYSIVGKIGWIACVITVALLFDSIKIYLMQSYGPKLPKPYVWLLGPSDAREEHLAPFFRMAAIMAG